MAVPLVPRLSHRVPGEEATNSLGICCAGLGGASIKIGEQSTAAAIRACPHAKTHSNQNV